MFIRSADLYDRLYSFKDYSKEALVLQQIIHSKRPAGQNVLDIACGTAEHHKYLKASFQIEGLDINADFIRIAKTKNPEITYHLADMSNFQLGRKYDVITCLFSSIAYLIDDRALASALHCMYSHLEHDGLLIIEPWFSPDQWVDGKLTMLTYESDDIKICRMSKSITEGSLSILDFHYLSATTGLGIEYFSERHELALRTREEMTKSVSEAGFVVEWDEKGIAGRGLVIGVKKS